MLCMLLSLTKVLSEGTDKVESNKQDGSVVNTPLTGAAGSKETQENTIPASTPFPENCTGANCTNVPKAKSFYTHIMENKEMLMRTFYVLLAVTSIVLVYFAVKAWRMRRRRNKSRKYGLITTRGSDLEMEPLDGNEEDDDMTVFEINGRQR